MTILIVDVHYAGGAGVCAGITFDDWGVAIPEACYVHRHLGVSEYQSGKFYQRELPAILGLLSEYDLSPETIVVDGYVYLDGYRKAGLGKHLYDTLGQRIPVIGIAKSAFRGIGSEFAVYRGTSKNPLYVTSVGTDTKNAKQFVASMCGKFRLPDLVRQVDRLARSSPVDGAYNIDPDR